MTTWPSADELIAEGASVPTAGWDFSWFEGRATEQRPSWGYVRVVAERLGAAEAALDVQTGGGEVLAEALGRAARRPGTVVGTESWPPNVALARRRLAPLGASVVEVGDAGGLPFRSGSFDLVVSRHPTVVVWEEVARVLQPGGAYLSQQVGAGSNRELIDFLMGPQPVNPSRSTEVAVTRAESAGLTVVDLRRESLRAEFFDVAAVVHFLRKVPWTVPDFTVERYRDRLLCLHEEIGRHGVFVAHVERFLIEALAPTSGARG